MPCSPTVALDLFGSGNSSKAGWVICAETSFS
jgi:hypothetical protein